MTMSPLTELGDDWQRFSICHADYRQVVREARFGLLPVYRGGGDAYAMIPESGAEGARPAAES